MVLLTSGGGVDGRNLCILGLWCVRSWFYPALLSLGLIEVAVYPLTKCLGLRVFVFFELWHDVKEIVQAFAILVVRLVSVSCLGLGPSISNEFFALVNLLLHRRI